MRARRAGRVMLAFLGMLLFLVTVKERYDPFLVLFLSDLLHPPT